MPAPFARVIEALTRTNFVVAQNEVAFDLGSHHLNYLAARTRYTGAFLVSMLASFGAVVLLEALQRGHGEGWRPGYFAGVCRNVASEQYITATEAGMG